MAARSEAEMADVFRRIRDEIGEFCRTLLAPELDGFDAPPRPLRRPELACSGCGAP